MYILYGVIRMKRTVFSTLAVTVLFFSSAFVLLNKNDKANFRSFEPEMIFVEGGMFTIKNLDGISIDTTLSSFYIGKYEITQGQWVAVMDSNYSVFQKGDHYPVENISWHDALKFITKLNILTGKNYRLPTGAEWEYAARGGAKSKKYKYSGSNNLTEVGWVEDNSDKITHPVGTKQSNELGIFDMTGNVREWCSDRMFVKVPSLVHEGPKFIYSCEIRGSACYHFCGGYSERGFSDPNTRKDNVGFRVILPVK